MSHLDVSERAFEPKPEPEPDSEAEGERFVSHDVSEFDEPEPEPFRISVITAKELCELPAPAGEPELVGPFLKRARITLLGGTTGHGKTTFGAQMLAAGVLGGDFLGWQVAGGLHVLVIDLEQHVEDIQEQLGAVGLAGSELVDYATIPEGLQIDRDPEHLAELERVVSAKAYDAVRCDPFYKLHAADSSDELQARELVHLTRRWVNEHGFALLMDTHTRKRIDPKAGFMLDDLFGSSLFARDPEVILGLKWVEDGFSRLYVFKARGRRTDLRTGQTIDLLYDDEALFTRRPDQPDRDVKAELIGLGSDYEWRTLNEWRSKDDGIGAGQDAVRDALTELHVEGVFDYAEGPPGRSKQAKCWRLRPTDLDPQVTRGQSGESNAARDTSEATDPLTLPLKGSAVGQSTSPSTGSGDPEAQVTLDEQATAGDAARPGVDEAPPAEGDDLQPKEDA